MPSPSDPPETETNGLVARREARPLNVRINPDLFDAFVATCAREDVTQRAALHEAICCWLGDRDAIPAGYEYLA